MRSSPFHSVLIATLTLIVFLSGQLAFGQQQSSRRGAPGSTAQQELDRYRGGPSNQDLSGPQTYAVSTDQDSCTDKRYCQGRVNSTGRFHSQSRAMEQVRLYLGEGAKPGPDGSETVE